MPNAGPARYGPPCIGRSKIERLKKRPEFLKVAASRAKSVTPGLILQAHRRRSTTEEVEGAPGNHEDKIRVGYTVSRKVGNAVQRNRARRRLRAVAEAILPSCGEAGRDYVLIGRRETLSRPFAALSEDLRLALRQLGARRWPKGKPPHGRRQA